MVIDSQAVAETGACQPPAVNHWLLFEAFAVFSRFGHVTKSHDHLPSCTGNLAPTFFRLVTREQKKEKKKKKKKKSFLSLTVNLLEICLDHVSELVSGMSQTRTAVSKTCVL